MTDLETMDTEPAPPPSSDSRTRIASWLGRDVGEWPAEHPGGVTPTTVLCPTCEERRCQCRAETDAEMAAEELRRK